MKKIAALTLALALTTGLFSMPTLAAGDVQAGEKVYKRLCSGCHQIGESARASFGPQLNGVIGRHSAVTTDYVYSDAMKSANLVWDRETLIAYLEAPKKVVSGTRAYFQISGRHPVNSHRQCERSNITEVSRGIPPTFRPR